MIDWEQKQRMYEASLNKEQWEGEYEEDADVSNRKMPDKTVKPSILTALGNLEAMMVEAGGSLADDEYMESVSKQKYTSVDCDDRQLKRISLTLHGDVIRELEQIADDMMVSKSQVASVLIHCHYKGWEATTYSRYFDFMRLGRYACIPTKKSKRSLRTTED